MYDYTNCYFCKGQGFVVEGQRFHNEDDVMRYLTETCYMDLADASNFLSGLVRDYNTRMSRVGSRRAM